MHGAMPFNAVAISHDNNKVIIKVKYLKIPEVLIKCKEKKEKRKVDCVFLN